MLRSKLFIMLIALGLLWAGPALAVQVNPPPAGFTITGFIQEATLDGSVAGHAAQALPNNNPLAGGTITVNGIKILVPNNLIVQMPAAAFTWQQMFNPAISAPVNAPGTATRPNHRAGQTGLALADNPLAGTRAGVAGAAGPFPSFEVTVQGNIKFDVAGNQTYIAGLIVPVSQQSVNTMSGIVNFIDYTTGRFRVGGLVGNPLSGTLCEINDPVARYGLAHSPDRRFTSDTNNPTISTATAYPVGIPRPGFALVNGVPNDPLRPVANRPLNNPASTDPNQPFDVFLSTGAPLRTWTMPAAAVPLPPPAATPDPWQQIPLMVGDWVDFSGTLCKINPVGLNTAANSYVSVHTMRVDLGVYTQPGTVPVYVNVGDKLVFGTDGSADNPDPNVGGPAPGTPIAPEFTTRVQVVGFCTDAGTIAGASGSATVTIYAVNNPAGTENYVFIPNSTKGGSTTRDNPALVDAVPLGRFRIQPGKILFYPPPITNTNNIITREYRVVHSNVNPNPGSDIGPVAPVFPPPQFACNGLPVGWFQLPNFAYLTPEHTVFGNPQLPSNFQDFPFLFSGDNYAGFQLGKLDPWPGPF